MENISGYGLRVTLRASVTFPQGISITQFADDADPLDIPSIQIADKAMGLNGDLIVWGKANPLLVTLNVIPGSDNDKNLSILAEANRTGKGKAPALDVITLVATYPDGSVETFTSGAITDGMPGRSVASSGRQKTRPYVFAFENRVLA
jgi:hypothetical protein